MVKEESTVACPDLESWFFCARVGLAAGTAWHAASHAISMTAINPGSAAGLTFISIAQDLGKKSLGELAFLAVVVMAIGNASGRILAGWVSDKIGRQWTLFITMTLQATALFVLYLVKGGGGWLPVITLIILIGGNYGSNLALFPSAMKDFFGLKNFGLNYGLVFTAWGAAGLIMSWMNGRIKDITGNNNLTYFIIIALLLVGAGLTFVSRKLARNK